MNSYRWAVCLGILCLFVSTTLRAQKIQIPGTRVTLDAPPGFVVSRQFPGLERNDLGASILVTEIPGPYEKVAPTLNAENLATRGVRVTGTQAATIAGTDGKLMTGTQTAAGGVVVKKWIAVFGDSSKTVLLMATFPLELEDRLSARLRAAVLAAAWAPDVKVTIWDGLGFRIQPTEKLAIQQRFVNMLMLAKPGRKGVVPPQEPLMVVGTSLSEVQIADAEQFARMRIMQTAQIKEVSVKAGQPISVDGLSGYELLAIAKDKKSDWPLMVYQTILLEGDRYFIVQGFVGMESGKEYLGEFRTITNSLRIVN